MDALISGLYQTVLSGIVVGIVVAFLKVRIESSNRKIEENSELKFKNLTDKLEKHWEEISSIKDSMDLTGERVNDLRTSSQVLITEQKNLSHRMDEVGQNVKSIRDKVLDKNYGRVIRKDDK